MACVYYAPKKRIDLQDSEIDDLADTIFIDHDEWTRNRAKREMHDYYRRWQNMYHQSEDTFEDTARLIHDTCYCSFGGMHIPPDLVEKVTVVDSLIEEVRIAWHRDNLCRTACVAELARMLEAENKAEQWRIEKYDDDYDTRTP